MDILSISRHELQLLLFIFITKNISAQLEDKRPAMIILWNATAVNLSSSISVQTHSSSSESSLQVSIWVIILMSLTCLFTIVFILCGLFKRADAYQIALTANGEVDITNTVGLGLHGDEGMFGVSDSQAGWWWGNYWLFFKFKSEIFFTNKPRKLFMDFIMNLNHVSCYLLDC